LITTQRSAVGRREPEPAPMPGKINAPATPTL
jgi:hypothetical protein